MINKDPQAISGMFDTIATKYDKTNVVMSMGFHNRWNRRLIKLALKRQPKPQIIGDFCCGTGALCYHIMKKCPEASIKGVDVSQQMLKKAQGKFPTIEFLNEDVTHASIKPASLDLILISYGIRNIQDLQQAYQAFNTYLKPGGTLATLELTRPQFWVLNKLHNIYNSYWIPFIGKVMTGNENAYKYLNQSIDTFPNTGELHKMLSSAHFCNVESTPLLGSIATITLADKKSI